MINQGLEMATGEWFNWLNSDDILLPHALKNLVIINRVAAGADWISGGRLEIAEDGSPVDICIPWRIDSTIIGLGLISLPHHSTYLKIFLFENTCLS